MSITIEIMHSDNHALGALAVVPSVDIDRGPLSMPEHLKIGLKGHDGAKIENYPQQVDEYDVWLEDQIKEGNIEVLTALDEIFQHAQGVGVILKTRCVPTPYITHAHQVKRAIETLAKRLS